VPWVYGLISRISGRVLGILAILSRFTLMDFRTDLRDFRSDFKVFRPQ